MSFSPTSTYCSELEYLIGLQSEENSSLRRSQRLLEKRQSETEVGAALSDRTECGTASPQLFVEIEEECSQLAQVPPNYDVTTDTTKNSGEKTLNETKNGKRAKKRRRRKIFAAPRRTRRPKLTKKAATKIKAEPIYSESQNISIVDLCTQAEGHAVASNPGQTDLLIKKVRRRSNCSSGPRRRHPNRLSQSLENSQMVILPRNQLKTLTSYAQPEKDQATAGTGTIPPEDQENLVVPAQMTNATQTYSHRCMNLTQTLLPERYPAHFIHQLPSEPKHIDGSILPPAQSLDTPVEVLSEASISSRDSETDSSSSANTDSYSSTPSLSESLVEIFGTKKLREVLNMPLPVYRIQDFQLPAIAVMLGVDVGRLRDVLEYTEHISQKRVRRKRLDSPGGSSDSI